MLYVSHNQFCVNYDPECECDRCQMTRWGAGCKAKMARVEPGPSQKTVRFTVKHLSEYFRSDATKKLVLDNLFASDSELNDFVESALLQFRINRSDKTREPVY